MDKKTADQLRDEVWANNTRPAYPDESVDAVRAMREEDQRVEEMKLNDLDEVDDGRTPEQFVDDLFRALGLR